MRAIFRKVLCLLSSAVLLCSATAMTASADDPPAISGTSDRINGQVLDKTRKLYYIENKDYEVEPGETVTLKVEKLRSASASDALRLSYQWYKDGKEIPNATSSSHTASSKGDYYCKVTHRSTKKVGSKLTHTSSSVNTNTVTVYRKLYMNNQNELSYIGNAGTATIYAVADGGKRPYTYEWTLNGKKKSEYTAYLIGVSDIGEWQCKVTDSRGKEVMSKPIKVSYPPLTVVSYTESALINLWTEADMRPDATATISVKTSGGSGHNTYYLQKKEKYAGWIDVTYSYEPKFDIRRDQITDNPDTYSTVNYGIDGWYRTYFSTNTNYYRIIIRSYAGWGQVVDYAETGEIKVSCENGAVAYKKLDGFEYP